MKRIKRVPYHQIKNDMSYTIKELAELLKVYPDTIRKRIKDGMPVMKDSSPWLLKGSEVKAYFKTRKKNKNTLRPNENYCPKCKRGVEISDVQYIENGRFSNSNPRVFRQGKCKVCRTNTSCIFSKQQLEALKSI